MLMSTLGEVQVQHSNQVQRLRISAALHIKLQPQKTKTQK